MFWIELIIALSFGFLITLIFSLFFQKKGPWTSFFPFFLLISLGAWAAGLWLKPVGPAIFGYYWVSVLIAATLIALIITVAGTTNKEDSEKKLEIEEGVENTRQKIERQQMAKMDLFFASLIVFLLLIITLGYLIG